MQAKTVHFHPHEGPITLVKIKQDKHILVLGILNVGRKETLRNIWVSLMIKVHGEKRQIGCNVTVSKTFIEFNTVNDLDTIDKIYVPCSKISMTVTDPSPFNAIPEKVSPPSQKRPGCPSNDFIGRLRDYLSHKCFCLLEVLFTVCPDGRPIAEGIDVHSGGGLGMESAKDASKVLKGLCVYPSFV
jgi:hypothetical protein